MENLSPTTLLLGSLLIGCGAPIPTDDLGERYPVSDPGDPSAELYAVDNLPRFDIEIDENDIESLADEPREWVHARLRYRGESISNVGVRLKGEYSFRPIDQKPSFKLKFGKYVDGQSFRGLAGMTLNNNIQDPSMLSQVLGYQVYAAVGVPAPRASLALVYLNGEYYGVYTNVENEDATFIGRWFDDATGNIYEEGGVDFLPGNTEIFELETNEDENNRSDLEALIAAADESTPEDYIDRIGEELDIDSFLRFAAVEAIVGGLDGYNYGVGSRNNFRIYRDPTTQRFYFIPWGLDRALRPRFDPMLVHPWVEPTEFFPSVWDARGVLLQKCIDSRSCRARFVETVADSIEVFEALELGAQADAIRGRLEHALAADERMAADLEYVDYATSLVHQYIEGRPASLRSTLY